MKVSRFRTIVWAHYKKHGRHDLPWRQTYDLYKILVSEVMLQQTQVDRVIPFYKSFTKQFPTAKKLAVAPLSDVLKAWQGLGYNRRAKMLQQAAEKLVAIPNLSYRTNLVFDTVDSLEELPGVGSYTARAVAAFAYNQDGIVIETNIRTVIIHHFFSKRSDVKDTELAEILEQVLPKGRAREWYSALMDYGAFLKRSGISHNAKGKGYAKQSKFAGSLREARGVVLRALAKEAIPSARLKNALGAERRTQIAIALDDLLSEGLVQKRNGRYALAD